MIISKKALPRRTFLKGVGATLALPLLDAMIPAATALEKTVAKPVKRLGFVFMPMGCDQSRWTPGSEKNLDKLSPILDSLAPVKDRITVMTNMELANAYPGSHATSNSSFLSAAKAKHTETNDYYLGTPASVVTFGSAPSSYRSFRSVMSAVLAASRNGVAPALFSPPY